VNVVNPNPHTLSALVDERLRDARAHAAEARLASGRIAPLRAASARLLQSWAVWLEGAHRPARPALPGS
jgi:hypothetical protein